MSRNGARSEGEPIKRRRRRRAILWRLAELTGLKPLYATHRGIVCDPESGWASPQEFDYQRRFMEEKLKYPSVGRVLHFYANDGAGEARGPFLAHVTASSPNHFSVALMLPAWGVPTALAGKTAFDVTDYDRNAERPRPTQPGALFWEWPPRA